MKDSGETGINGAEGEAGSKLSGKRTGSGRNSGKALGATDEAASRREGFGPPGSTAFPRAGG